jgi:hypothetical protein
MIEELIETTEWDAPCFTYYIEGSKLVAYRTESGRLRRLKTPMKFDKRYRKFQSKKMKKSIDDLV